MFTLKYTSRLTFNRYIVFVLLLLYIIILVGYQRSICWHDPTSKFFQPEQAHIPHYSTLRIDQSIQYADTTGSAISTLPTTRKHSFGRRDDLDLCIGIPSVRRKDISYLKLTLGSLQQGLSPKERSRLHFVVLLAHLNQTEHSDYGSAWLNGMVDTVTSYHDSEERLRQAEIIVSRSHPIKSKFDYAIVMEECAKVGAPYIMMIEDDVVFLDGWRHRTVKALEIALAKSWEAGESSFLYLRMFYYEGLLGWNSESWPTYLGLSILITATVLGSLLLTRRYTARTYLTNPVVLFVTFALTPFHIALFFAAGRNCMLPQPLGVYQMDKYACCGQGLVFPRSTVTNELLPLFQDGMWSKEPTDSFIEKYADNKTYRGEGGALRWALTPVVLQHVGGQSSHNGRRGSAYEPRKLWNFAFERNDAHQLAIEHEQALELVEGTSSGTDLNIGPRL